MEECNNAIEFPTLMEWLNNISDKFERNSILEETLFVVLEFGKLFHESLSAMFCQGMQIDGYFRRDNIGFH